MSTRCTRPARPTPVIRRRPQSARTLILLRARAYIFLSLVLADEVDRRDRSSAELGAHVARFDLGRRLEAFSTPEPRNLGPLLRLVVDGTDYLRLSPLATATARRLWSCQTVWMCLATEKCPNDHSGVRHVGELVSNPLVTSSLSGPGPGAIPERGPPEARLISSSVVLFCVNADSSCVRVPRSVVVYR
jgi:hypothetical protein